MCYAIGEDPRYPNGRRCSTCHGIGRSLGRKAKLFYGELTEETRAKLSWLPDVMQTGSLLERAALAKTTTNPLVFEAAVRDRRQVQEAIASNLALPYAQAKHLADHGEDRVRLALAGATTDQRILESLAQDDERSVRRLAAERLEALKAAAPQAADTNYRMAHQAPVKDEDGYSSAADLTVMLPGDIYQQMDLYMGAVSLSGRREIKKQLLAARGNPDALVTIYRSLPMEHADISRGDWVSLSRAYAEDHIRGEEGWHVISTQVRAGDLVTEGDLSEWGYDGDADLTGLDQQELPQAA